MDKNTVTGLVLMALVMFGFMWLSSPKDSDRDTATQTTEQSASKTEKTQAAAAQVDSTALAEAVRSIGTASADGVYEFSKDGLALRYDSVAGLTGTYSEGGVSASLTQLLNGTSVLTAAQANRAAASLKELVDNSARYEGFARYLGGKETTEVLENELVKVTLSSRGAMVSQVELKKYKSERGANPENIFIFRDNTDGYGFRFNTAEQRIDTRDFNFQTRVEADSSVLMYMEPAPGAFWGIRYRLNPEGYNVSMEVVQKGMEAILPASTANMEFSWNQKLGRNEVGRTFEERNSAICYNYIGEGVDELNSGKDDSESINGRLRWVAFKNQFFSSVIISRSAFTSAELVQKDIKSENFLKDMSMTATVPYTVADGTASSFDFYFGPNDYPILSGLDEVLGYEDDGLSLTRLIPLGWTLFRWINTIIVIPVFTFLGSFIDNYGIIILLLTLFIKLIIFPFTFKSFKSQAKMRVLAPEIKEINDKYPDQADAMKRQQEVMALYSRVGASPFAGCLPMLLQMPVLIAMFSFFPSAIELRGQSFLWAHDLSAPDSILTLPFSIPFYGNHVSLFCLLMTIVNIVYMKVSQQSQPQSAGMPGMKFMMYLMPVMFLFIFNDYASGLSYYYLLSLLITIIQTYIFRHVIDEKKVREQLLANARKPRKKSGFMARLEEAQRQAQAAQRAQQQQQNKRRR